MKTSSVSDHSAGLFVSTNLALEIAVHTDDIVAALCGHGWLVLPNFFTAPHCNELLADCQEHHSEFASAAVGRGTARRWLSDQRSDATLWLRDINETQRDYLQAMDNLRNQLNRHLYLGLRDYEAHYAHYAPGAFYRRHCDAFAPARADKIAPQRIVSSVVYLNASEGGGELVLWPPENTGDDYELMRIAPVAGTAVFFLSAQFPHEVLPARADRYSIAGWFRG